MSKPNIRHWSLLLVLIIAVALVYQPGAGGLFQFDDYSGIVNNEQVHLTEWTTGQLATVLSSSDSSPLKRPIAMLSFATNHYFSGLTPSAYKLTNIAIHCINTLLVFFVALMLLRRISEPPGKATRYFLVAFFIALAWGVHPLNLTSVLYVVQRMTSLATLFVLLGLIAYLQARDAVQQGHRHKSRLLLLLVVVCGLLAILTKEIGALLFVYVAAIELLVYRGQVFKSSSKTTFTVFFVATLVAPAILVIGYTLIEPGWILNGYLGTDFTITERLLTESRVIWSYASWIVLPNNQSLGLFHDDIPLSTSLLTPATTLISLAGHLVVAGALTYLFHRRRFTGLVLGLTLFYCSQLIESTIFPLEIAHEHRVYFGGFGLLFGIGSLFAYAGPRNSRVIALGGVAFILFISFLTWSRASSWGHGLDSAILEVHHHPRSSLAHYELARQYRLRGNVDSTALTKAREHYMRADELSSTRSDGLFALLILEGQATDATQRKALLTRLEAKLSQAPLYASHANWLATLVSCYARQSCRIDEQELLRLIRIMVKHQDIDKRGIIGAVIYANAADFILYSGKGSYQEMMALMEAAATTDPGNAEFGLGIVDKALAHGDIEMAAHWIKNLKAHSSSLYNQRIVELEQRLERLTR